MKITVKEFRTKSDLKAFIYLPEKIHKNHKNWLYPIYSDDWKFFSKEKNFSFSYCDTILLLAYEGQKLVGRVMGIINNKYNQNHNEKQARFCFLETYDNPEITNALLEFIENWAKSKSMVQLIGPFGFSDKEPQGLLVEGFVHPTVLVTNHSFKYLVDFVENRGYSKKIDLVHYKLEIPDVTPELYTRASGFPLRNGYRILEFTKRKELKKYIDPVFRLINESYTHIFGFAPFSDKEIFEFANRYIYLLDPRLIKIVVNQKSEVLSFIISMQDISEGINKARGRIFPFGIFHILNARKKSKQLNLMLGAVKENYRNQGFDSLMAVKLFESARKLGLKQIDSHVMMETNMKMRAEVERVGGTIYKRYRIYKKDL